MNQYNEIVVKLQEIAKCARIGDYAKASSNINICLQDIQKFLILKKNIPSDFLEKIKYSMETMHLMMQQKDWVAFADIVEYEFIPLWNTLK